MTNRFIGLLLFVCLLSCQDKYLTAVSYPATGTLKKDSSSCLPQNFSGTYWAGKEMNDSNFLEITVNVKTTGTYTIRTNTVNGISFSTSGSFGFTGTNTIKLKASGKAIQAGVSNFTVQFDTSVCRASVTVLPAGGVPPDAVYHFSGAPGACSNIVVSGTFPRSVVLDTFNKVAVQVNVITAGAYTVSTNTVNGYGFSGKGVFSNTGLQTIVLYAKGTPAAAGTDQFTVNGNNTSCGFSVQVVNPVVVTGNDHFPLTGGSYWTYDDLFNAGDTMMRSITDSVNIGGILYKQLTEQPRYGSPVQSYFRRQDTGYYENTSVDKYTLSVQFSPKIVKDFPFLREYLNTGDTWSSDEYIGTATFGQQIFIRYDFTCINSNASVTVGGKTFTNVYQVALRPKIKSATTYPYNSTSEYTETWYAKGIGMIYTKKINNNFTIFEYSIRNWQVK